MKRRVALTCGLGLLVFAVLLVGTSHAQQVNIPIGPRGTLPLGEDGKALNLDFETGTLKDWTATGKAFDQQPHQGKIDPKRPFGADKHADFTGEYWIGGYEFLRDTPRGTLTSAAFKVTQPWCSFLFNGGRHKETRVELVEAANKKVFFAASGKDLETLFPHVVNLEKLVGKKIFVRLVDNVTGGWGHINFDDFRLHAKRPKFPKPVAPPDLVPQEIYKYDGLSAKAAAKAMRLPPGFSVNVAAAEPDVMQPIAMAIDDRGRVWIAEAFEYPIRAPEGKGRDRILIFEDTNLDGRLDRRTVFAEKLNLVSGLEVGFGGVWVGAAPYLLFIPDANGDDKPDGPPVKLLDGWGQQDTHETLNTFIWGPDGWLYGCHGVFTHSLVGKPGTPKEQRTGVNAAVWRYHPTRHEFDVFSHGTSNPWGVDFNDHGQAILTACVIPHLYHMVQGGRYQRQGGVHFNPHTYDDIKTIADHRHFTGNQWNQQDRHSSHALGGGHAHAGAMVYLGGSWPAKYRNQIFMNNIHGARINMDTLAPRGSGFVGGHGPDFILTDDVSSQIINLRYGPDGQAWMIDWYDRNQCHHRNPAGHDRTNGRIFRVAYGDAKPVKVDLKKLTDEQLLAMQLNKNDWYVRHARRVLQERAAAGKLGKSVHTTLAGLALSRSDPTRRLRGLWALHVTGGLTDERIEKLLTSDNHYVRAWTIQLAMERGAASPKLLSKLAAMAREDASPVVRLYIASALQRIKPEQRWEILAGLTSHAEDAKDHNLPLMYWYAAEPLAAVDARRALAFSLIAGENIPLLRPFMIRRIGGSDVGEALALLVDGLGEAKDDTIRLTFLRGINQALEGRRQVGAPEGWAKVYGAVSKNESADVRLEAMSLAVTFGDPGARRTMRAIIADKSTPVTLRRRAIDSLLGVKDPALPATLQSLLGDVALRGVAFRGLAAYDDAKTPGAILAVYRRLPLAERRDALATLASRPAYAAALLTAIEKKQLPATDLSADLVRQLRNLGDAKLTARLTKAWGTVRESSADRKQLIADYKTRLAKPHAHAADLSLGRAVFAKTCQQCHTLFGSGAKIGPDLTGSNRANLDYLLSNVLDPSSVMAKEYQPSVVITTSGRVVTGIVKIEGKAAITMQTANELVLIPRDEIDERKLSTTSMMPDDLLKPLTWTQARSLIAYLGAARQVPMLATKDTAANLFNGKDLAGWHGNESLWSVENGEIVGKTAGLKGNEFLISEMTADDFHLSIEVKLLGNRGNSGVQFRSQPLPGGSVKGYQADIGVGWWGKLYEEHGRGLLWKQSGEAHLKPGEWNTYEIRAVGPFVETWLNGKKCVDLVDAKGARRGVFALQLHSGGATEVRFRNLRLRPIVKPPAFVSSTGDVGGKISFKKHQLDDKFRSEGVCVGDFNRDGKLDIAAGSVWFSAPDWKRHNILEKAEEFNPKGYSKSFVNAAEDFNGDGWPDLLVVDFPGAPTWWFANPGKSAGPWKRNLITPVTNNESPDFRDVDGDGRRELFFAFPPLNQIGIAKIAADPSNRWPTTAISAPKAPSTAKFAHGLGAGDVNGDGRNDVLVPQGWWEAPAKPTKAAWKFHPVNFGPACAQMIVYDFDGDGDADVLTSSAHGFGIWWHEQISQDKTALGWKTHLIDKSFSETHSIVLADINGDGLPDFVTGKRWWSHGGHGPGGGEPAVLHWFELKRVKGRPVWTRHQIDNNSGVGTAFEVADVNGDGLLDIVTSNKKGTFYFMQQRE